MSGPCSDLGLGNFSPALGSPTTVAAEPPNALGSGEQGSWDVAAEVAGLHPSSPPGLAGHPAQLEGGRLERVQCCACNSGGRRRYGEGVPTYLRAPRAAHSPLSGWGALARWGPGLGTWASSLWDWQLGPGSVAQVTEKGCSVGNEGRRCGR